MVIAMRLRVSHLLLAATLSFASHETHALVPADVLITAECGGGAAASFGPGAHATDRDGSIYRLDWAHGRKMHKVARNTALVGRWRETLDRVVFQRVDYDKAGQPWCGILRRVGSDLHAVRWPVAVDANGVLKHLFEGMPPEIWFVYLQMQQVARDGEACSGPGEPPIPFYKRSGSIELSCGSRDTPRVWGVRILADGDVLSWHQEGERLCSSITGHGPQAFERWSALLDKAGFEELGAGPGPQVAGHDCGLARVGSGGTEHDVRLLSGRISGDDRIAVSKVASGLAAFAADRCSQGYENATYPPQGPKCIRQQPSR